LQEHRQTIRKHGKRTTTVYRWLTAVPLRATEDAIVVNWFSIEIFNDKGKRTYHNSFVTDLAVSADTPWPNWPPAAGRAGRSDLLISGIG